MTEQFTIGCYTHIGPFPFFLPGAMEVDDPGLGIAKG